MPEPTRITLTPYQPKTVGGQPIAVGGTHKLSLLVWPEGTALADASRSAKQVRARVARVCGKKPVDEEPSKG